MGMRVSVSVTVSVVRMAGNYVQWSDVMEVAKSLITNREGIKSMGEMGMREWWEVGSGRRC